MNNFVYLLEKKSVVKKQILAIQIVVLRWSFIFYLSKLQTFGGARVEDVLCKSSWMSNNNYKSIVFDDNSNSNSNDKKQ